MGPDWSHRRRNTESIADQTFCCKPFPFIGMISTWELSGSWYEENRRPPMSYRVCFERDVRYRATLKTSPHRLRSLARTPSVQARELPTTSTRHEITQKTRANFQVSRSMPIPLACNAFGRVCTRH